MENIISTEIGKKAENLEKLLQFEDSNIYTVPYFKSVEIGSDTSAIKKDFIKRGIKLVSVRSSSDTEDTDDDSKAGAFQTYINIDINDIDLYIKKIQDHSLEKFGYKIPIIIQKMVNGISGVAFSTDPDSGKNYINLNYHNGDGEDLVSGNITGNAVKIFSNSNREYLSNDLHKKMFDSISYLKTKLDYKNLDIEFVFDNRELYLLQVRPITKINNLKLKTGDLINRYLNYITNIISKKNIILGDMIDINPEELVGNQSILIKTFFGHIFPETSLREARLELGYLNTNNFYGLILDKNYVNLEENLKSFLPNNLTEEEVDIFINYYKELILEDMSLQNQLDSILYPNNLELVYSILNKLEVNKENKDVIIKKFEIFFDELSIKMDKLCNKYTENESSILSSLGVDNFGELLTLNNFEGNINDLLELIKKTTFYFSIYARIFFFSSNRGEIESNEYFKKNIYQSDIIKFMNKNDYSKLEYELPEGFNFLSNIKQYFDINDYNDLVNIKNINNIEKKSNIDISKVARENLKFIFMNLFRIFGKKISEKLFEKGFTKDDISFINFDYMMKLIEGKISIDEISHLIEKGKTRTSISKIIEIPSVVTQKNSFIENKVIGNNGFYSGTGSLEGNICIINNIQDFNKTDYIGKIIIIENATPEIDIYLKNIKGIITKNGGPLAHIMIRSRELGIPAVVGTEKYDEIINKVPNNLKIDFINENIVF